MASAALLGLEAAQESMFFPATGKQPESVKPSAPIWSIPTASKDSERKVYISEKHKQDVVGRDSPGPVYIPRRQRSLPSWQFGTALARPPLSMNKYPSSSNDLMGTLPDGQVFKYESLTAAIGTCPRFGKGVNSPDYCGFEVGKVSPGPQRYMPTKASTYSHRLSWAPDIDHSSPSYTMRVKTKVKDLPSSTPLKVGPGMYPVPEACMEQASSEKASLPRWSFAKNPRFPKPSMLDTAGRLWDGDGQQKILNTRSFSRSPNYSFGTSTRAHRKKVAPIITPLDMGPAEDLGKVVHDHPTIGPRKEIIKYTDVPAGHN